MGSQEAGDDGSKFLNILRVDLSDVAHPEGICIGELARVEDVAPLLDVGVKLGELEGYPGGIEEGGMMGPCRLPSMYGANPMARIFSMSRRLFSA